jgi:hypothetical protein
MNRQASDPLSEVDALVQAYLAKRSEQVDGARGLARVQAALGPMPKAKPARRGRAVRLAFAAGLAATVALAFFSGWHLNPVQAGVRELVEEVKRVHNLPLARCYLVEIQRIVDADEDRAPVGKPARQVRVWTRGDRFWAEMQHDELAPPFIWGRGENGSLWAVLDSHRGVQVPLEQAPRPLQRVADLYTLNVDTLLADLLHDCTLTEESAPASKLTRVVVAEPRSDLTRRWLGKATLEIDGEARVLRRLVLVRNVLGKPLARVTFTLLETRPDDDARYQLEGHLTAPFRIHEGNIEPRVKLELLGRWFGVRKEGREKHPFEPAAVQFKDLDGHVQTPLAQTDRKGTVLFFLLPDCPISNAYAPEIERICVEYGRKRSPRLWCMPIWTSRLSKRKNTRGSTACRVRCCSIRRKCSSRSRA